MTDAAAGAREMVRVTRPGGVVAACVWDFAGGRAPQSLFFAALGSVVYGHRRRVAPRRAHAQATSVALLRRRLHAVEEAELTVAGRVRDRSTSGGRPTRSGVSPAGKQLAAASAKLEREHVRERRCASSSPSAPFTVTATAWSARGEVVARQVAASRAFSASTS